MSEFLTKTEGIPPTTDRVKALLEAAYAPNTRKAIRSDIAAFVSWGGSIPSNPNEIAAYIAGKCETCAVSTIKRHLASLSNIHSSMGCVPNPIRSPLVAKTLRGLIRLHGKPQRAVEPLLIEDLRRILDRLPKTVLGIRDAALLTIGFAGGMRRSELVGLNFNDLSRVCAGLKITIQRSKTDQAGQGRVIAIPHGRTRYCPVSYLDQWFAQMEDTTGAIFRGCTKGSIKPSRNRLSVEAVAITIKKRVKDIGLDPTQYSGHSLRAGYVTSAIKAGAAEHAIRRQTGHASGTTMERYIRIAELFEGNATSLLF
jgi:integrase